jgi:hypothetical protein
VAVVVALVPAAWLGAQRVVEGPADSPSRTGPSDLPIPPVSPSATPTTTTPEATPTATATTKAPALTRVAPDAPRRLVAGGLIDTGFDSAVTGIDASSDNEVARWESRGSPGSPGTDTVYVIGRVGEDRAFAALPRLAVGAKVTIRTDRGTLTYTVRGTSLQEHAGLEDDAAFIARKPGRLVLVGIRYDASGDRLGRDLVVVAQLTAARRS